MERKETPAGRKYDAWFIDGQQVGTLGAVMQAGQRFEDPSQIDFLGVWEDVRLGAYDPQAMIKENEMDGVWGSCLQPSQGLFWYRRRRGSVRGAGALREAGTRRRVHPGDPAGGPALSPSDLRAVLVDGAGRRHPAAAAHRDTAWRCPGVRVHHERRRAQRRGPTSRTRSRPGRSRATSLIASSRARPRPTSARSPRRTPRGCSASR